MRLRFKVLQGATVLLYTGPLLAGLAGAGWGALAPFAALFVCWLTVQRPHQWPQRAGDWLSPHAMLAVLGQVLAQVVLVAMLLGIGRGIGGVAGFLPLLHPLLPLAVSFLALPVLRLVWDPVAALERGHTIEDAFLRPRAASMVQPAARACDAEIAALLRLPDRAENADRAEATRLLERLLQRDNPWPSLAGLAEHLAGCPADAHLALRHALIAWSADRDRFAAGAVPGGLRLAFAAAGQEERLLHQLLPPALDLARNFPGRQDRFPSIAVIEDIARRSQKPALRRSLTRLAQELTGSTVALPA